VFDRIVSRHGLSAPVAAMLGEALALAALLAGALKYEGIFTLQTKGRRADPADGRDVTSAGAVRGYAQFSAEALARVSAAATPCRACSAPAISPSPSIRRAHRTLSGHRRTRWRHAGRIARIIISGSPSRSKRASASPLAIRGRLGAPGR